ncbi:N-acetylglucosamine-6-phosphate deacetylase [Caldisericum exile]|uniref:N-acetylglucosamine-6-phosphate deacetylase n=1 Tax=Caldisericum exile (strain DSM 21853 / NBRC 104410 / AZM16c01) TaxID=511051 RepID=A0A7U6GDN0_CALEA|nr:N-acetylglucosamine-6-phosphate deacetylase [Caldisericum exile]BAL80431.1 N-acetylglucosamine-6-phosphate deacetylase [Caldisericum exile AZM16c01]
MEYKDVRIFKVSRMYTPNYLEGEFYIKVVNGTISEITKKRPDGNFIDLSQFIVMPGFVDVHIHGFEGFDVSESGMDAVIEMSRRLPKTGVVAFLPTFVSIPFEDLKKKLESIKLDYKGFYAVPLGVHVEGAFINPKKKGAMDNRFFISGDTEKAKEIIQFKNVKMLTVAPEVEGALEVINFLVKNEISVSIGHSDATFEEVLEAYLNGANSITHLFNAMAPFNHREPSVIGGALYFDFYLQIIADTHHTSPYVLKLLKPYSDRVVLITDAIEATNLREGVYKLGSFEVFVKDGTARLSDGTLAGSILTMDKGFKNLVMYGDFSIEQAVRAASLNPLKSIHNFSFGEIKVNKLANFVCVDNGFNVRKTIINGEIVYEE